MSKPEEIYRLFQPTFGNRPEQYIGRDGVIEQFMEGLKEPIGSRNRCTLFLGQRGMQGHCADSIFCRDSGRWQTLWLHVAEGASRY